MSEYRKERQMGAGDYRRGVGPGVGHESAAEQLAIASGDSDCPVLRGRLAMRAAQGVQQS